MRHVYVLPLLLIGVFSHSVHASSAIYKWVDQNGTTQYTQTPPPKNAKSSKTVRVSKHIPADVREGRVRPLSGLDAVSEATQNTDNTASPVAQVGNSSTASTSPIAATQSPDAAPPANPNNNSSGSTGISSPAVVPAPVQSSTVPSAPVPLVTTRPEQF